METMTNSTMLNTEYPLTQDQIDSYRRDGFIQLPDVLLGMDLEHFRESVESAVAEETAGDQRKLSEKSNYEKIFTQRVNLWRRHSAVREFVLSRRFGNLAARLSGHPARIWHDQALFKAPEEGAKTPWHQDAHYWPHQQKRHQITLWMALRDATIQNGCMSFLPGTQVMDTVPVIDLGNPKELFDVAPQLKGLKPKTCELKAGSCTFHAGLTFHFAGPNRSNALREAFAIIYMPDGTTYNSQKNHMITDGKPEYRHGEILKGEEFPVVSDENLRLVPV